MGLVWHESELYAYFRDKVPVARAGYSIRLYRVSYPPDTPVDRAVVVGTPTYDVPPQILGVVPGHRVTVKWGNDPNVFVFAMNGPARYVVPDLLPFDRNLRRAFRSAAQQDGDALIVDARPLVESRLAEWRATAQPRLPDGAPLDLPANFDGKLALIGYRIESPRTTPGGALDLTTYWQVTGDLGHSLAFFAHVIDASERIVGQYDGWGTALRGLEVGDVIVQHVTVPIKPDTSPGSYILQLGVYVPDTMTRWTTSSSSGASADRIVLSSVEITSP